MISRILYIGFKYEYGIPSNGEGINYRGLYGSFNSLGYDVHPLWYDEYNRSGLQREILNKAQEIKPDLVFIILQKDQVSIKTLDNLRSMGLFVVNWFGDDQWRFDTFTAKFAPHLSACITTDKYSITSYRKIGQPNVIRSQWASLESSSNYANLGYLYDTSFVGAANSYRRWFIQYLRKKGIAVHCFGEGWPSGKVTWEQMASIFRSTKINLNISNSAQYDLRFLISHPRNAFATLRRKKNMSQPKARNFEIPVHGGFQLTEYVPSLEDYFCIGKDLACYKDIDEAVLLTNYYIENEGEREKMKLSGINKARNNHTFSHRVKEFMTELEQLYCKWLNAF